MYMILNMIKPTGRVLKGVFYTWAGVPKLHETGTDKGNKRKQEIYL